MTTDISHWIRDNERVHAENARLQREREADRAAMKFALEALSNERYVSQYTHIVDVISLLRDRLETT